ncbi:19615_t:CDS:2 [Funneliformis geosporum]|uniref:19615_t:CDS:1 n=1 Tax=Funneliformis geosporum TaxID=1117311 RepID=A0A9W4WT56_9GLOM|nr:19615_t:CDS:2 [Funneliformis geosporum]
MNKSGSFSAIYSANWAEGPRRTLDVGAEQWIRSGPTDVVLKRIDNSQNMSQLYLNQLYKYHICLRSGCLASYFGITKDPTSNYAFVMKLYEGGDLNSYLGVPNWKGIVDMLWDISAGIRYIHDNELIHGNIHGGNILIRNHRDSDNPMDEIQTRIADVGIHGPVDRNNSNDIYGVLPYVAPEVLKGSPLSKASDIYSFGMIMWILAAGVRPWCNRAHDLNLAKEICSGLRPEIPEETPYIYIQLMEQCWDPDPSNRPSALHLCCMFEEWTESFDDSGNFDADPVQRLEDSDCHPQAFYTSNLLYFPELINS